MNALILVKPSEDYIEEIRAYRQEFFDFSSYFNGDSGLRKFEDINAWIEQCRLMENKETLPNPDRVEAEQFMLVDKSEKRILGMINFRHYLNAYLAEYAGHIGYAIRPSERRRGYATAMLKLCLHQSCVITPLYDDFILHDLKISVQLIVAYPFCFIHIRQRG